MILTDETIREIVERFLGWTLPEGFAPDGGIRFAPSRLWPVGTNLFTAAQAEEMVRYILDVPDMDAATIASLKLLSDTLNHLKAVSRAAGTTAAHADAAWAFMSKMGVLPTASNHARQSAPTEELNAAYEHYAPVSAEIAALRRQRDDLLEANNRYLARVRAAEARAFPADVRFFMVSMVAQNAEGGVRAVGSFVAATNDDEAIGRALRVAEASDAFRGDTMMLPAAVEITPDVLAGLVE